MRFSARLLTGLALLAPLPGCVVHHVKTYDPGSASAPQTADAATTSTNCFETSTAAERLACADPTVSSLNQSMTRALQTHLRQADIFGRDALMASQRDFLLGLPAACHLPDAAETPPPSGAAACLAQQFSARITALAAWHSPARPAIGADATAQYLRYRLASGIGGFNQPICAPLAAGINAAISHSGGADPAAIPGATAIAGSHGSPSGSANGATYGVALFDANAYGGFQQRARGVAINGHIVLDALALGSTLQATAANNGARFSAYGSQTGDYGAAEVFTYQGQTLALISDAWGFTTPAAPGEYAHAAAWNLGATPPQPVCLFDIFQMPAETGTFENLPSFGPWRALLAQLRASAQSPLGVSTLRDQAQLRNETSWTLLHMPLLASQEARSGDWTLWLRLRHDQVLDTLFTWSTAAPANKQLFDQLFRLLRPAAQDLVTAYQQTQALDAKEAKEAAGLAIMELLYSATETIAPGLGADLAAPGSAAGKPRYPILAAPA